MADMLWVRIRTGIHHMTRHAVRLDDSTSTVCGLEITEEDEIVDQISVTDDVCNNCLRVVGMKADEPEPIPSPVEPALPVEYVEAPPEDTVPA